MTPEELRELDIWIAQQDGIISTVLGATPRFTTDPAEFARVQREIKRRGWSWQAQSPIRGTYYWFAIFDAPEHDYAGCVRKLSQEVAETEELAGCLAFKQAVEATEKG